MNFIDKLLGSAGLVRSNKLPSMVSVKQAYDSKSQWVRIGGGYSLNRDLQKTDLYTTNDRAYRAWLFNPFVKRITETWVNYVVGSGITFKARDARAQGALDRWLERNLVHTRMRQRAREAFLFGELINAPIVNTLSGNTRLRFVDPLNVSKVEMDPIDGDRPVSVDVIVKGGGTMKLPIVREDESGWADVVMPDLYGNARANAADKSLTTIGRKVGKCVMLRFNSVIGASRGASDLVCILDWCSGTEDLLWSLKERTEEQNKVVGLIRVKGATPQKLARMRNPEDPEYIPPPEPNSYFYANENIDIEHKAPNIGASESKTALEMFQSMIQIGSGNTEISWGQASNMTYASAKEATSPFYQMMQASQSEYITFWQTCAEFELDQHAIFTNEFQPGMDLSVEVTAPDIAVKDEKFRAEIGTQMTNMVMAARQSGAIDDMEMRDLFAQIAAATGLKMKQTSAGAGQ